MNLFSRYEPSNFTTTAIECNVPSGQASNFYYNTTYRLIASNWCNTPGWAPALESNILFTMGGPPLPSNFTIGSFFNNNSIFLNIRPILNSTSGLPNCNWFYYGVSNTTNPALRSNVYTIQERLWPELDGPYLFGCNVGITLSGSITAQSLRFYVIGSNYLGATEITNFISGSTGPSRTLAGIITVPESYTVTIDANNQLIINTIFKINEPIANPTVRISFGTDNVIATCNITNNNILSQSRQNNFARSRNDFNRYTFSYSYSNPNSFLDVFYKNVFMRINNGIDTGYTPAVQVEKNIISPSYILTSFPILSNVTSNVDNGILTLNTTTLNFDTYNTQIPATTLLETNWRVERNNTLHIPDNQAITPTNIIFDDYSISFTGDIDKYYFIRARFKIYDTFGNFFFGPYSTYVIGYYLSNTYIYRIELFGNYLFPNIGFGWAGNTSTRNNYLGYMPPPPGMDGITGTTYQGGAIPGGGNPGGMIFTRLRYIVLDVLPPNFTSLTRPSLIAETRFENGDPNDASPGLIFSSVNTTIWEAENLTDNYIVNFRVEQFDPNIPLYLTAYYSVS